MVWFHLRPAYIMKRGNEAKKLSSIYHPSVLPCTYEIKYSFLGWVIKILKTVIFFTSRHLSLNWKADVITIDSDFIRYSRISYILKLNLENGIASRTLLALKMFCDCSYINIKNLLSVIAPLTPWQPPHPFPKEICYITVIHISFICHVIPSNFHGREGIKF